MPSLIDPLSFDIPIVNADGTPTPLLSRLLQKPYIKAGSNISFVNGKLDVAPTTRSTGDNTTNIATTAFVENVLGAVTINTTGGTTVLTQDQAGATVILIKGTLTSNAILQFGSGTSAYFARIYDVRNQTSGAFTVAIQACATGPTNTYTIAPGGSQLLFISSTSVANAMTPFQASTATVQPGLVPVSPGGTTQFLRADGSWAVPAGGGGGGSTPTIRSSNIASYNGSSATITFPTGTVAGDIVVIYWENGFAGNYSAPSGWTPVHLAPNSGNYTNQNCAAKIMTSADITAGSVVVNAAGSYNGITAAITLTGTTVNSFDHSDAYDSSGSTSISSASVTGMLGIASTDLIVGFASTRAADTLTVSSNMTILQTINAANASGIVFSVAAAGITKLGLLETITAHVANNGLAWTTLAFR